MKHRLLIKAACLSTLILLVTTSLSVSVISKRIEQNIEPSGYMATIVVDDEGDGDYTLIQDAIDAASPGDIIEVYSGTYIENLNIDFEVTLTGIDTEYMTGNDSGKPIINGGGITDVITLFTDGNNYPITISGFIITNSGARDSGIFVDYSIDVTMNNNVFMNNHHGVNVYHSCTTIDENVFQENDWGILTEFSDHCIITENTFVENTIGFQLESSHALSISRNNFYNNSDSGLVLIRSPINDIIVNNFDGNGRNAWFKNCWNKWNDNYWGDRPISLPFYIIIGEIQSTVFPALRIPVPQFDLRAKSTPN